MIHDCNLSKRMYNFQEIAIQVYAVNLFGNNTLGIEIVWNT